MSNPPPASLPHFPASPPSRRPPAHATIGREVHCGACWYDLRGLPYIGRCPECGTRYNAWNSVRRLESKCNGRRDGYIRPISNVDIVPGPNDWRAAGLLLLMATTTGAGLLLVWWAWRMIFG